MKRNEQRRFFRGPASAINLSHSRVLVLDSGHVKQDWSQNSISVVEAAGDWMLHDYYLLNYYSALEVFLKRYALYKFTFYLLTYLLNAVRLLLSDVLGEGAFGVVLKAEAQGISSDKNVTTAVAVKTIKGWLSCLSPPSCRAECGLLVFRVLFKHAKVFSQSVLRVTGCGS